MPYPRFNPQTAMTVDAHNGPEEWTGEEWNAYVAAAERAQAMVTVRILEIDGRSVIADDGPCDCLYCAAGQEHDPD